MTWNILEYSGSDTTVRNPHFRKVVAYYSPDILVIEEIHSQQAMNIFLSGVMNSAGSVYSMGTFINGPDTDNGIFYKTSKFIFISNTRIPTAFRDINEFKIKHINYPDDTLRIFAVHLYPGTGSANENRRAAEVDSLRKFTFALPANTLYMVAGDFNITGSNEQAYIKLIQAGSGRFIDMLPYMPGLWNNPAYSIYHTMSSRTRSFGGGSTGGLKNRFDLILVSPAVYNNGRITYVPGSLTALGNDGNHYGDSVNKRPNISVPDSIADALHYSSDHLPEAGLFTFGNIVGFNGKNEEIPFFTLEQNYPNPFNPVTKIKFDIPSNLSFPNAPIGNPLISVTIYDILGKEVATLVNEHLKPGSYEVEWNATQFPSGIYFCRLETPDYTAVKRMILVK